MSSYMIDGNMDTSKDFWFWIIFFFYSLHLCRDSMFKTVISLSVISSHTLLISGSSLFSFKVYTCQECPSTIAHFSCLPHLHMTRIEQNLKNDFCFSWLACRRTRQISLMPPKWWKKIMYKTALHYDEKITK